MFAGRITKICSENSKGGKPFVPGGKFIMDKIIGPVVIIAFTVHEKF